MSNDVESVLTQAREQGIALEAREGRLVVNAPRGDLSEEFKATLASLKEPLLRRLAATRLPPLEAQPVQNRYPLSAAQLRMWAMCQDEGLLRSYNMSAIFEAKGPLDLARLQKALDRVVQRHESLRTRFVVAEGKPWQVVEPSCSLRLDQRHCADTQQAEAEIQKFLEQQFNFENAPLFRVLTVRWSPHHTLLAFAAHHIICDGWSVQVLVRDALLAYEALGKEASSDEHALKLQYRDYVAWQTTLRTSDYMEHARAYWRAKLAGDLEPLALPTDHKRPARPSGRGASCQLTLGKALSGELKKFAHHRRATLFAVLTSVLKVVLYRYTHQKDVIVGIPASGRVAGLENQVGLFVNSLPLRSSIRSDQRFGDMVAATQRGLQECYEWQYCPFEDILESIAYRGNSSRNALFDVMAVMDEGWASPSLQGISFRPIERDQVSTKVDLAAIFREGADGLEIRFEYSSDIFDAIRIERMLEHFKTMLESALLEPDEMLGELTMLPSWEKEKLLFDFNNTAANFPLDRCVHELFESRSREHPERVALALGDAVMTYGELNARSNALAHKLRNQLKIPAGSMIALLAERSFDMVVAILAILKAGGVYVPIDPTYPAERIRFMLKDCGAALILYSREYDELNLGDYAKLNLKDPENYASNSSGLSSGGCPSDLAYCIYTSGSTGQPKGVLIEHRSLANLCAVKASAYILGSDSRVLQFSSPSFDASIAEIFPVLIAGGRLILLSEEARGNSTLLANTIRQSGANVATFPPSLLADLAPARFEGLSLVISAGEVCIPETVKRWSVGRRFINAYGPSECTVCTTLGEVGTVLGENIPIGRPVANVRVRVLSPSSALCPIGIVGELCAGGIQVARGYLNRVELTAEKFIADRYNPGGRLYRTGDLGRWLPDGQIEYLGRMDDQVKVRGFRIELGEIEAVLGQITGVRQAAVVVREVGGDRQLCGYYGGEADESAVRAGLRTRLPEHMVPGFLSRLDSLPLTASGKVDRKALPMPERSGREYQAPRTELEKQLAALWQELLGVKQVGIGDSFFELGGHSLKAMQLTERIWRLLQVELKLHDVFQAETVREMAELIAQRINQRVELIEPATESDDYVVSHGQKRLWVLSQYAGGSVAYNIPGVCQLEGRLEVEAFKKAFSELVRRHESLRTVFFLKDGEPRQRVLAPFDFSIEERDLSLESDIEAAARVFIDKERNAAFDLEKGSLLRAKLLRTHEDKWLFLFTMHHVISDGWSMGILVRDVMSLYEAFQRNEPSPLVPLSIQYRDYAVWQNRQLEEGKWDKAKQYWQEKLGGELPVLDLPTDRARPPEKSYRGASWSIKLEKLPALKTWAKGQEATLFMVLTAAVKVLLYRYTGQEDLIVGTPIAGRENAQLKDQIGFYVGTLALRDQVKPEASFVEVLKEVKQTLLEAYEHQQYPFDRLVEELKITRDMSRHPLFDVMVVMNEIWAEPQLERVKVTPQKVEQTISKFDLSIGFSDEGERLGVELEYDNGLFDADRMDRMGQHLQVLVDSILRDPNTAVSKLEILPEWEKHKLLVEFNDTAADYPKDKTVHELFEEQVERTPNNIAVVFEEQQLTYVQLNARANQVARRLHENGVVPDQLVAIMVDRSLEMIVGIMGILKSGGAYVPIDPAYPQERIKYMLEDTQAKVLLTQSRHLAGIEGFTGKAIDLEDAVLYTGDASNLEKVNKPTNLIYVIYTSGSTGRPKGVMIEHRSVVNFVQGYSVRCKFSSSIAICSYTFDVSVFEFFASLLGGSALHILSAGNCYDFECILKYIETNRIDHAYIPPFHLNHLSKKSTMIRSLKCFLTGVEPIEFEVLTKIKRALPALYIINGYGPTESTVCSTFYTFQVLNKDGIVPIGKPCSNAKVYILGRQDAICPIGTRGEICIEGKLLARGYLNQPELTAEKFTPNPYGAGRLYRTGDLGRWLPDGNIEYSGRMDDQVKIRGFRIELGEIEAVLGQITGVRQAAVVVREVGGDRQLCGYYSGEADGSLVRVELRKRLPEYMVPGFLSRLDSLPLTASGKVDRKALPTPERSGREYQAPRTELEIKLVEIWQEVLGLDKIGVNDNFFDLGGNSLKAVRLVSRMQDVLGLEISLREVFKADRIAELSCIVEIKFKETLDLTRNA